MGDGMIPGKENTAKEITGAGDDIMCCNHDKEALKKQKRRQWQFIFHRVPPKDIISTVDGWDMSP